MDNVPSPSEIKLSRDKRTLTVTFDDARAYEISAELLRVESPSAEVQGHNASQKTIVKDKADVAIVDLEPVGNYAIKIAFDDQHDTGIYKWATLFKMGNEHDVMMAEYKRAAGMLQ